MIVTLSHHFLKSCHLAPPIACTFPFCLSDAQPSCTTSPLCQVAVYQHRPLLLPASVICLDPSEFITTPAFIAMSLPLLVAHSDSCNTCQHRHRRTSRRAASAHNCGPLGAHVQPLAVTLGLIDGHGQQQRVQLHASSDTSDPGCIYMQRLVAARWAVLCIIAAADSLHRSRCCPNSPTCLHAFLPSAAPLPATRLGPTQLGCPAASAAGQAAGTEGPHLSTHSLVAAPPVLHLAFPAAVARHLLRKE